MQASFADMRPTFMDGVAAGDDVWVRVRAQGVETPGVAGMPATGRGFAIDLIDVTRFHDGKVVEHWDVVDRIGMLEQLGLLPSRRRRLS